MSIRKKMQELKRELILEEAALLFIEDGFENMKIVDLAKKVGVSVGTIYTLFGSKDNLYQNYLNNQIEHYLGVIKEETSKHSDPIVRLRVLAEIRFGAMIKHKNAIRLSVINDPTFFINISDDKESPLFSLFTYITENVMTPLAEQFNSSKEPLDMTFLFDGLAIGMIKYWMVKEGDLLDRVDELVEDFLILVKDRK